MVEQLKKAARKTSTWRNQQLKAKMSQVEVQIAAKHGTTMKALKAAAKVHAEDPQFKEIVNTM